MTQAESFLFDIARLIIYYNKELMLALLLVCLICFIRIYIEFIRTEKALTRKARYLQYQEKIKKQETKNKNIIAMLETF